jgi:hypothetical protein
VRDVAPEIFAQVERSVLEEQFCHWYVKVPDDVQVPLDVESVDPSVHEPVITGAPVLITVNAGTTIVGRDEAVYLYAVETVLLPNTCERMKYPTSLREIT